MQFLNSVNNGMRNRHQNGFLRIGGVALISTATFVKLNMCVLMLCTIASKPASANTVEKFSAEATNHCDNGVTQASQHHQTKDGKGENGACCDDAKVDLAKTTSFDLKPAYLFSSVLAISSLNVEHIAYKLALQFDTGPPLQRHRPLSIYIFQRTLLI